MGVCVCMCVYIYIYIYTCVCVCVWVCVCVCMCVYVCVYIYIHMHLQRVCKFRCLQKMHMHSHKQWDPQREDWVSLEKLLRGPAFYSTTVDDINPAILHYQKDPKLWELWHIADYG